MSKSREKSTQKIDTISALAMLVQQEFSALRSEVNERFDDVDSHFKALENRMDANEQVFGNFNKAIVDSARDASVILREHETRIVALERAKR